MIDLLYAPVKVNPTLRNRWVLVLNSKQNLTKLHLSRRGGGGGRVKLYYGWCLMVFQQSQLVEYQVR